MATTPRRSRTAKAAPAAAPSVPTPLFSPEAQSLLGAGWQPSQVDSEIVWFHQRKSRGQYLSIDDAVTREGEASQEQGYAPTNIDADQLGPDVATPDAPEVLPDRNPLDLIDDDLAPPETVSEEPEGFVPFRRPPIDPPGMGSAYSREHLAAQADADARAAAIERAERSDPGLFPHDQVGAVILWRCDHCHKQVRYATYCTCKRCEAITEAEKTRPLICVFCGNDPSQQAA